MDACPLRILRNSDFEADKRSNQPAKWSRGRTSLADAPPTLLEVLYAAGRGRLFTNYISCLTPVIAVFEGSTLTWTNDSCFKAVRLGNHS
jgi:hypothetical protein